MQHTLTADTTHLRPAPRPTPLNTRTLWAALALVAILWALAQAGLFQRPLLNPGGWPLTLRFFQASLHPNLSPEFLKLAFHATLTTLAYAVCGTILSLSLGFIGGLLTAEVWWQTLFNTPRYQLPWLSSRALLTVPRSIHEIIWGLFFINILGLNPLVAILAIAIPYGAITAKVFADILDSTPRDSFTALQNSGVPPVVAFLYSLLPQALPNLLSYSFYRFECALRSAAILGAIGAGGLGYEILLSSQALHYDQVWTFLYALIAVASLIDLWSGAIRQHLSDPKARSLAPTEIAQCQPQPQSPQQPAVALVSLGLVFISGPLAWWYVQADFSKLFAPRTQRLWGQVWQQAWPPAHDPALLQQLWTLTLQTLALSIIAITIATLGGAALSFLAARNFILPHHLSRPRRLWGYSLFFFTRTLLLFLRAIPPSIWALVLLFVLFPGILPGALALGVYTLGVLGRLMAESVENLEPHPTQALQTLGASGPQTFFYSALPRALPNFLAYSLYRWEVCARETIIVGIVGAGGLGRALAEQLSNFNYPAVFTILLAFIGLTLIVDLASALTRRALK